MLADADEVARAGDLVLADLAATAPSVRLRVEHVVSADGGNVQVRDATGVVVGTAVYVEQGHAEAVAHLASTVQDLVVEDLGERGEDTAWPPCPRHPGTHPLDPVAAHAAAVWTCPRTGEVIAPVGELGTAPD